MQACVQLGPWKHPLEYAGVGHQWTRSSFYGHPLCSWVALSKNAHAGSLATHSWQNLRPLLPFICHFIELNFLETRGMATPVTIWLQPMGGLHDFGFCKCNRNETGISMSILQRKESEPQVGETPQLGCNHRSPDVYSSLHSSLKWSSTGPMENPLIILEII